MSKEFYTFLGKTVTWPNLKNSPDSLTYDDVLLVPQISPIESRRKIDTSIQFGPYTLSKPIISAPMDTISGEKMIRELARLGALGTLPRGDLEKRKELCRQFTIDNIPCMYAVGLKNGFEEAKELKKCGAELVVVDIAHGGLISAMELARKIKQTLKLTIVLGNIVTYPQALEYIKYGIDIAKVGVGPGGTCKTRLIAGTGYPQLSAIFETTETGIPVIADGGIKQAGDFAKAIAAGASAVMIGTYFGATDETPGNVIDGKKLVRGQASTGYMHDNGIPANEFRAEEGTSVFVPAQGAVENKINELMGGLRSAMSYAGAANIEEFKKKALFKVITVSVQREGAPWIKSIV